MSWSLSLSADRENIQREVADAKLPDYCEKNSYSMTQLHCAKEMALKVVDTNLLTEDAISFSVSMHGHHYTEPSGNVISEMGASVKVTYKVE